MRFTKAATKITALALAVTTISMAVVTANNNSGVAGFSEVVFDNIEYKPETELLITDNEDGASVPSEGEEDTYEASDDLPLTETEILITEGEADGSAEESPDVETSILLPEDEEDEATEAPSDGEPEVLAESKDDAYLAFSVSFDKETAAAGDIVTANIRLEKTREL